MEVLEKLILSDVHDKSRTLVAAGTCRNEALDAEMRGVFRQVYDIGMHFSLQRRHQYSYNRRILGRRCASGTSVQSCHKFLSIPSVLSLGLGERNDQLGGAMRRQTCPSTVVTAVRAASLEGLCSQHVRNTSSSRKTCQTMAKRFIRLAACSDLREVRGKITEMNMPMARESNIPVGWKMENTVSRVYQEEAPLATSTNLSLHFDGLMVHRDRALHAANEGVQGHHASVCSTRLMIQLLNESPQVFSDVVAAAMSDQT